MNYCVKALLDQGWIKVANFTNSSNKRAYAYLLTASGLDAKARMTARFLKRKIAEYEVLRQEIACLKAEVVAAAQADYPELTNSEPDKMGLTGISADQRPGDI